MKFFTSRMIALAAVATISATSFNAMAGFAKTKRVQTVAERWGDAMGATGLTSKTVSYYDKNFNLLRQATYGRDYSTGEYQLSKVFYYEYDTNNNLTLTYYRQYGLYNGKMSFNTPRDSVKYTYNDANQLVKKDESSQFVTYTYDESGNLKTEVTTRKATKWSAEQVTMTTTYNNYKATGCPGSVVYQGLSDYNTYSTVFTYNDQNKVLTEISTNTSTLKPTKKAVYTYDETGELTTKMNYTYDSDADKFTPQDSTVYYLDNDDVNRIAEQTYTYDNYGGTGWNKSTSYNVSQYRTLSEATAATITVVPDTNESVYHNNNSVTVNLPTGLSGNWKYYIYCDETPTDTIDDSMVSENSYHFVDAGLENGTYEYFVVSTLEENGVEYVENISNIASIVDYVELPAPTNVRATDRKEVTTTSSWGTETSNTVSIAWDAADYTEDLRFQRYNVVMKYMQTADNFEADGQDTFWDFQNVYSDEITFTVQAVYDYGTASSEEVTIKVSEVPTSVNNATADNVAISYTNGTVTLGTPANITVFNAAGATVAKANDASTISLANQAKGTYIIVAENAGKLKAYKVVK